jgi:hypothetical protein
MMICPRCNGRGVAELEAKEEKIVALPGTIGAILPPRRKDDPCASKPNGRLGCVPICRTRVDNLIADLESLGCQRR